MIPALLLLILLTQRAADAVNSLKHSSECLDCNENEPWWPLFKPSQLVSSEFPEHRQYKSIELPDSYGHRTGARAQARISKDHSRWENGSLFSSGPAPNAAVAEVHTKSPDSAEKNRGTSITKDSTNTSAVPQNDVGVPQKVVGEQKTPPISSDRSSSEPERGEAPEDEDFINRKKADSSDDFLYKSDEASASSRYDSGSFSPSRPFDDFDVSKEFTFSNENFDSSNSVEFPSFSDFETFGRENKPVATSYSSFSSVFAKPLPIPLASQARHVAHPVTSLLGPGTVQGQGRTPVSHFKFYNGRNVTGQFLVHDMAQKSRSDPGTLWINHGTNARNAVSRVIQPTVLQNRQGPFIPVNHPVYRYVKNHGGMAWQNKQQSQSKPAVHWQQGFTPQAIGNHHMKISPQVRVQNHETIVRHVIPTKSPFSDHSWKESRKIERFHAPPHPTVRSAALTYYIFKKTPNALDIKRIDNPSNNYVYIMRNNERRI